MQRSLWRPNKLCSRAFVQPEALLYGHCRLSPLNIIYRLKDILNWLTVHGVWPDFI